MAMGGAHSIDGPGGVWGPFRGPGNGWWPQETISYDDAQVAMRVADDLRLEGRHVDVMVTHDCPLGVDIPGIDGYEAGVANRRQLTGIVDHVEPQLLVCGHYHRRVSGRHKQAQVEILSSNVQEDGHFLLVGLTRPLRPREPAGT